MLGVYMSLDLVGFVISWFVAALAMCHLCGSVTAPSEPSRLGRRLVDIALIPSLVLMAAVVTMHLQGRKLIGIATFDVRNFQAVTPSVDVQYWLFAMFLVAFVATLAGVFRWWLSVAASRSVLSVSVILAAVFLKMGTYGFVRLTLPLLPDATRTFAPVLVAVAAVGILFGAVAALAQPNWTRVLAYATFSHICLVLLGTFALTPDGVTGSIVHQISHGVSIAALLFLAGVVAARGKGTSLAEYGGLLTTMPVVAALWLLSTLSLVAVPKLSGFVGTRLIIEGSWSVHPVWSVVAIVGLGVSALALLWLFARTMLGELRSPSGHDLKDLRLAGGHRHRPARGVRHLGGIQAGGHACHRRDVGRPRGVASQPAVCARSVRMPLGTPTAGTDRIARRDGNGVAVRRGWHHHITAARQEVSRSA